MVYFGDGFSSLGLNGIFELFITEKVFDSELDNISVRTIYHQNHYFMQFLKSLVATTLMLVCRRNLQKCNSELMKKSHVAATIQRGYVTIALPVAWHSSVDVAYPWLSDWPLQ